MNVAGSGTCVVVPKVATGPAVSWSRRPLFQYNEPRFFFSLSEQRVLARAVLDDSDEEIARELGLSIAAVKKIWRRVYERVDETDPDLRVANEDRTGFTRGKESRRNLIGYLRYPPRGASPARPATAPTRRPTQA